VSADGLRVRRVSAVPEGDVAIDRTIYAEPLDAARFADVQRAVQEVFGECGEARARARGGGGCWWGAGEGEIGGRRGRGEREPHGQRGECACARRRASRARPTQVRCVRMSRDFSGRGTPGVLVEFATEEQALRAAQSRVRFEGRALEVCMKREWKLNLRRQRIEQAGARPTARAPASTARQGRVRRGAAPG
jgi:hypothetical protein